jgi:hypothetical protein
MADRDAQRTEANVQSDLHALLLAAPLELEDNDLEIVLEQQAGGRRRIDVEAGLCVFEVKRDLRRSNVRPEAEIQLAGYITSRTEAMNQRYVGVLTDGADWYLYHLAEGRLDRVSAFNVDVRKPDTEGLVVWLEGVLATAAINPTPTEIDRRLGASSPGHAIDYAELRLLYSKHRDLPTVRLKRELWARLLTTAFGTGFTDSDELFVEHTLLVATAEVIAHAVIGLDPTSQVLSPTTIVEGQLFASSQVYGVVEADFFDWVAEIDGGGQFIRVLARRLSRFVWHDVEHDVLKVLYESIISAAQRKQLGEYYTPDWLADRMVQASVKTPLEQRVLDPSCGSGTFVFYAVRHYLKAASAQGIDNSTALTGLTQRVIGMDIHPVAVTLARVTYLLAIGTERLQAEDRPPISIPIYLGDSIQWGQESSLFTSDALVIPTVSGQLWATELRFPKRTLADAGRFDQLVGELARIATNRPRGSAVPSIKAVFSRYMVHPEDEQTVAESFKRLCQLNDQGRNHIWGYYVRNLARPVWLSRPENRVDVLIGNPPWLSYRFMTAAMQKEFRELGEERGLWAGAKVATSQDLSALFALRAIERYLKDNGRFGFVMPWSTLRGRQFSGFRRGRYEVVNNFTLTLAFDQAWDLHRVKPAFFPVPACVVFGERGSGGAPVPLLPAVDAWSGTLPQVKVTWDLAEPHLTRQSGTVEAAADAVPTADSPYASRFAQGATLVPFSLMFVEVKSSGPLGAGAGRVSVQNKRSPNEKEPWKSEIPSLEGKVERQFVKSVHLGKTVLPYRTLSPEMAVIPWDGERLLNGEDDRLATYLGLVDWWSRAEGFWNKLRRNDKMTLIERIDYQKSISQQFPVPCHRLVYAKSGMYLAAAVVTEPVIIEQTLYWAAATDLQEARYLEAIVNSDVMTQMLRPMQARGEHNPRHYAKDLWQVPVPVFDPMNEAHVRLSNLAEAAETIAAKVALPAKKRFEVLRRMVREAIAAEDVGKAIEREVGILLGGVVGVSRR